MRTGNLYNFEIEDKPCKFPYHYNGVQYHGCTASGSHRNLYWCGRDYLATEKGWCPDMNDLLSTVAHELGHVFGMGHNEDCLSIMYSP